MDDIRFREKKERRFEALKKERNSYLNHWREIADYFAPRRGRFLESKDTNAGGKKNSRIINSVPLEASRVLANGMMSGVTSPSRPWFRLAPPDPDLMQNAGVREWLNNVQSFMLQILQIGNFYTSQPQIYRELGVFGTAAKLVEADFNEVVRTYTFTAGEYLIASDGQDRINTFYRSFHMTVAQMVGEFGRDAVSDTVKNMYDTGRYDEWVEIRHAIEPNELDGPGVPEAPAESAKRMLFSSCYWEAGANDHGMLRQSGYRRFPVAAPRWEVLSRDVYGSSPGMNTLGDAKQLQNMEKAKARQIALMAEPPMKAPASLEGNKSSILPKSLTYSDEPGAYEPVFMVNPTGTQALMNDIRVVEDRINKGFYVDLFLMLANTTRREITAREIEERHEEKLLQLGPVLERVYDEDLSPTIDILFDRMAEADILPPAPPALEGEDLRVELISIMAQAQKMVGAVGIERLTSFAGALAQMNPEVVDKVDVDQAIEEYAEMHGVPPRLLSDNQKVLAVREHRARAQQAAQAAEMAKPVAEAVKTVGDTPAPGDDDDSILDRIFGDPEDA